MKIFEEFSFLGFPPCGREVRNIDFAEANGFKGFSTDASKVGRKWFTFLLKHYPKIKDSVTNLSIARTNAADKGSVMKWYKKYHDVIDQLEITYPRYIWNTGDYDSDSMP